MKKINEMINNDLINLVKIQRILINKFVEHNKNKNNFGFEISIKDLINKKDYYFFKYNKANYDEFGFKYIDLLIKLSKNNSYEVFIEELKKVVNFVKNVKEESFKLSKINTHYYNYVKNLKYINDSSILNYEIINHEKGLTLIKKEYIKEYIDTKTNYFKEDFEVKELITKEEFINFIDISIRLSDELEFLLIFDDCDY